ncbi:copper resistance protein CopC [Lentzea sp. NBC_00516]|uniref:copper resistance CopC family protein n=1 Tax=Lentzea sp. NBC_00516 TaxID=2903582 RepID=UPI002E80D574|nr:copper resistance CopC family protein [Lentzea sp. NBC_00516]WUD28615.1 copper resistance protein CopC [Lentzea sp. NBC_00516]
MNKLGTIVLVALFGLCVLSPPASAGGALTSSSPSAGARVSRAPEAVKLTFDRPVRDGGANVVNVTGPDGTPWSSGVLGVDGNVVTAVLSPLGPEGEYVVDYAVRLGDPAPLTGQLRFTLTKPGPAAQKQAAPKTTSPQTWAWLGGILAVVVTLAVGAGVLQARRGRR